MNEPMEVSRNGIKRKCGHCGETFYISKYNIEEAIYYDKKLYHSRCFINMCQEKLCAKRSNKQKWSSALRQIDAIQKDTCTRLTDALYREDIFYFILDAYDITIVPSVVWRKLNQIYTGTIEGMSVGIPPAHLLDMWRRKIDYLNGISKRNETKGKHMQPIQRLQYDLTILINKYDSYLKWLEKQRIIAAESGDEKSHNIVRQSIGYSSFQENVCEDDDISDLVDDIFG